MSVDYKRLETTVNEQGTGERTEVTHALGATIDGVFVPFLTKSGGYVDHLVEAGKAQQKADADKQAQETKAAPTPVESSSSDA